MPHALKEEVVQELRDMSGEGIIEESTSDWVAPIVVVKKKDGTNRNCIDYCKLNSKTNLSYTQGRRYGGYQWPTKYITTIDVAKGYWQVPMAESDRETAFSSPTGLLSL
uniref:Reverse transcriptase domain-containing protein n=1 Tax=Amphimedon queenslandica TaxID=400682 RepID=A0A1X7V6K6_AMPQE